MPRVFLIALLAAAVACSGKSSPTTPGNQPAVVVDAPLTAESLVGFVKQRFPAAVQAGTVTVDFGSAGVDAELLQELSLMGITTTAQLAAIVPADYETKGIGATAADSDSSTTLPGLVRDLLIIHDTRGYFHQGVAQHLERERPG